MGALILYAPSGGGTPGRSSLAIFIVQMCVLAAHCVAGYLLGRFFPGLIAIPLAAVGSFLVLAYPPAMEPLWLRHLVGTALELCCTLDQVPAERGLLAPVVVALGILIAASLALVLPDGLARFLAVAPLIGGLIAAALIARPLDWTPTQPRAIADLTCAETRLAVQVCTWPEQADQAETIQGQVVDALSNLEQIGVDYVGAVGMVSFPYSDPEAHQVHATIVSRLMPAIECPNGRTEHHVQLEDRTVGWLYLTLGAEHLPALDSGAAGLARQVHHELSPDEQRRWFTENLVELSVCPIT
jgi:hypothetical protein